MATIKMAAGEIIEILTFRLPGISSPVWHLAGTRLNLIFYLCGNSQTVKMGTNSTQR